MGNNTVAGNSPPTPLVWRLGQCWTTVMTHSTSVPSWRRLIDAMASSRLGAALWSRIAPPIDRLLMRVTRGRFAMTLGMATLLLTTTGRKSGQPRSTPLLYDRVAGGVAIIGSNFGQRDNPAWYLNLRANPHARVLVDGDEMQMVARDANPHERAKIWERAVRRYRGYEAYRVRASARVIPIVVLTRVPDEE